MQRGVMAVPAETLGEALEGTLSGEICPELPVTPTISTELRKPPAARL